MSLISRKLTLSGQHSKQLIHDMDHSIAQNKTFCLKCTAIEIRILQNKLNCTIFLLKIDDLLHQFISIEFTEVIMEVQ